MTERRDDSHADPRSAQGYRLTPAAPAGARRGRPRSGTARRTRSAPRCSGPRPGVNLSTVYRTLELLEELGLVTHAHLGPRRADVPRGRPAATTCTWSAATAARSSRPTSRSPTRWWRGWPSSTASRPTWPTSRSTAAARSARHDQPAAVAPRRRRRPTRPTPASPRTTATRSASSARWSPARRRSTCRTGPWCGSPAPDRLTWLHSLTSQHLERLPPGVPTEALVLSPARPRRARRSTSSTTARRSGCTSSPAPPRRWSATSTRCGSGRRSRSRTSPRRTPWC